MPKCSNIKKTIIDLAVPVPKELHHQEGQPRNLDNDWCGLIYPIFLCEPGCGEVACLGCASWDL